MRTRKKVKIGMTLADERHRTLKHGHDIVGGDGPGQSVLMRGATRALVSG